MTEDTFKTGTYDGISKLHKTKQAYEKLLLSKFIHLNFIKITFYAVMSFVAVPRDLKWIKNQSLK